MKNIGDIDSNRQGNRSVRRIEGANGQRCSAIGGQVLQAVHRHLDCRGLVYQCHHVVAVGIQIGAAAGDSRLHPDGKVIDAEHHSPLVAGSVGTVEFKILRTGAQLHFPPAAAVRCGAGFGQARLDDKLRVPALELLAQCQTRSISDESQGIEKPFIGVGLVAGRDVGTHRVPVEFEAGIPYVCQTLRSADRYIGFVTRFYVGPSGEVEVLRVPAQVEGRWSWQQRLAHIGRLVGDSVDRDRFAPFGGIDGAVNGGRLAHTRYGKARHGLGR